MEFDDEFVKEKYYERIIKKNRPERNHVAGFNIYTIVPYGVGVFAFLVGLLVTIGAYYFHRFQQELDSVNARADARVADFYDKYEDLQRDNTAIKIQLEGLHAEHNILCANKRGE